MENFVQSAKHKQIIPSPGCLFVCFELLWGCLICCSEFYCVRRWTLVHRLTHRSEQDLHWNNDPIANNTSWLLSAKTFRVLSCGTHDLYEQRMSYEVGNDSTLAVIHKWLPTHYSFVFVQISLPSLIVMSKIEKNSCSKVRPCRPICTITEQK